MSYAVRNDGVFGWRSIGGPDELFENEVFSVVEPPPAVQVPPTTDELSARERAWRDVELTSVLWLRERHRDQLEIDVETTLTAEQFKELLVYMQALRDWPQSPDFPVIEQRPAAPPWIAEQHE